MHRSAITAILSLTRHAWTQQCTAYVLLEVLVGSKVHSKGTVSNEKIDWP